MTITGNNAIDALRAGQVASTQNGTLDQNAFLKLMTTQLKTQDPFAPVDNAQMVAQMAQFSALAGTSEMNASLKSIAADIASSRVGDAASWIGRQALVKSDVAAPLSKGGYAGEIDLPEDATGVTVSLVDANGQEVHREELGDQKAGTFNFAWGGGDNVSGALRVIVSGKGADGALKAGVSTWTDISSVQSPASGSTKLVTTLGTIAPEEALSLS